MTKPSSKAASRGPRSSAGDRPKPSAVQPKIVQRKAETGQLIISKARFEAIMRASEQSGLLIEKTGWIGGRVSQALVKQAKRQTGIETDTGLIEFALATVALEDHFAEAFKKSRGKVDPEWKLGF